MHTESLLIHLPHTRVYGLRREIRVLFQSNLSLSFSPNSLESSFSRDFFFLYLSYLLGLVRYTKACDK